MGKTKERAEDSEREAGEVGGEPKEHGDMEARWKAFPGGGSDRLCQTLMTGHTGLSNVVILHW